jgi:hypothetical protein
MKNHDALTKSLAVVGTVLVWIPILAPIFFSVTLGIRANVFRLDYLMPAELFPVALLGGGLLIWAAFRARSHQRMVGWSFGISVLLLIAGQVLAVVTGLASGETEPVGWSWGLVLASLAGYTLALVATGISGLLLISECFKKPPLPMSTH